MNDTHGFTQDEIDDILTRERIRQQQHDAWCSEHEGEFTDADGVQTMTTGFWAGGY